MPSKRLWQFAEFLGTLTVRSAAEALWVDGSSVVLKVLQKQGEALTFATHDRA